VVVVWVETWKRENMNNFNRIIRLLTGLPPDYRETQLERAQASLRFWRVYGIGMTIIVAILCWLAK
jgi:hypothetical protein